MNVIELNSARIRRAPPRYAGRLIDVETALFSTDTGRPTVLARNYLRAAIRGLSRAA